MCEGCCVIKLTQGYHQSERACCAYVAPGIIQNAPDRPSRRARSQKLGRSGAVAFKSWAESAQASAARGAELIQPQSDFQLGVTAVKQAADLRLDRVQAAFDGVPVHAECGGCGCGV
jgi:hypothetical protein